MEGGVAGKEVKLVKEKSFRKSRQQSLTENSFVTIYNV
jgi:hypothetical protein